MEQLSEPARRVQPVHVILAAAAAMAVMIAFSMYPMRWYIRATFLITGVAVGVCELLRHDAFLESGAFGLESKRGTRKRAVRHLVKTAGVLLVACEVAGLTLWFLWTEAFRYFDFNIATFGRFWQYRIWLTAHILGGTLALISGPFQLWTGWRRRALRFHRKLGWAYVFGVTVAAGSAFRLAFVIIPAEGGMRTGLSMMVLGAAWLLTTGMGLRAIIHGHVALHKEWMIRSYIVALAFGTIRWLPDLPFIAALGSPSEIIPPVIWASWTVPLFITELVLQWRKTGKGARGDYEGGRVSDR
jgi:uncharacterized membrane protein